MSNAAEKMAAVLFTGANILKHQNGFVSVALIRINNYSTDNKTYNLSNYKRGTGGRNSFNGIVATVFGATGFVGRYVCNQLGKIGTQLIIPYRADFYEAARLKLSGDLGQVFFTPFHLQDEESIKKAMKYSNVVVNLVGRDWETKNFKFDKVHVDGARLIAKCAKESGVERLIHVSALNCSEHPPKVMQKGGSKFLKSKFHGEQAVLEEFPDATIFRPADIYGQEDRFLRYYANHWRRQWQFMPLWKKGEATIKQPIHAMDFATGIVNAIKDPCSAGKIYQAVGPKRYYLSELVDYFYKVMGKGEEWGYWRYDMRFDPVFQMKVTMLNMISPSFPIGDLHWERVEREGVTDTLSRDLPTLEDLGVCPKPLEEQVPWELRPFTHALYYGVAAEEPFPNPPPPKVATN